MKGEGVVLGDGNWDGNWQIFLGIEMEVEYMWRKGRNEVLEMNIGKDMGEMK